MYERRPDLRLLHQLWRCHSLGCDGRLFHGDLGSQQRSRRPVHIFRAVQLFLRPRRNRGGLIQLQHVWSSPRKWGLIFPAGNSSYNAYHHRVSAKRCSLDGSTVCSEGQVAFSLPANVAETPFLMLLRAARLALKSRYLPVLSLNLKTEIGQMRRD